MFKTEEIQTAKEIQEMQFIKTQIKHLEMKRTPNGTNITLDSTEEKMS
jgi:hypothetical protein